MKKCPEIIAIYTHMFDCPVDKKFSNVVYEHIQYPSNRSRIYFHLCENCRLRFDTDEEDQLCPRCKQSSENIGFEIREFKNNTFWGKLRKKISNLLP